MAITVKELNQWLRRIPGHKLVAIDDGGLSLVIQGRGKPKNWPCLEIGGIREKDDDECEAAIRIVPLSHYCDWGHETNEARILPTGGGGNMILCHYHFGKEMKIRKQRNLEADDSICRIEKWENLRIYKEE